MEKILNYIIRDYSYPLLKVLAIHDIASIAATLKSSFSKSNIDVKLDIIFWPSEKTTNAYRSRPAEYLEFKSRGISQTAKEIIGLSDQYDLFLCYNFKGMLACYIAGVNYIYHGTGTELRRFEVVKNTLRDRFLHHFFKKAFKSASLILNGEERVMIIARKYNKRVTYDKVVLDTLFFEPEGEKKNLAQENNKFVFLCPQRIEWDKGYDTLWKAISLTNSDFIILQCNWGKEPDYSEIMSNCPKKVKLIPLIKREEMPSYFRGADAILGNFKLGTLSSIEREAAACRRAVLVYSTVYRPEQKDHPFLTSNDPIHVAQIIDKIVQDEEFKIKLENEQYSFVLNNYGMDESLKGWNNIFHEARRIGFKKEKSHKIILFFIAFLEKCLGKAKPTNKSGLVINPSDHEQSQ